MSRIVRLDPEAEAELQEAATYYAARSKPLCRRFLQNVIELSRVVGRSPERFPRLLEPRTQHPVRRALVPGFPYALVFIPLRDRIHVLAICHTHRQPGYWLHRLAFDDE
jgi:plasmid stabilization system protein ParE